MERIEMKQGDLRPIVSAYLTDMNSTAVDLTSASGVRFIMKRKGDKSVKVDAAGVIADASAGKVTYQWSAGDTSTPGTYEAEFEVNWGSSVYQTFPKKGYIEVIIQPSLGGSA